MRTKFGSHWRGKEMQSSRIHNTSFLNPILIYLKTSTLGESSPLEFCSLASSHPFLSPNPASLSSASP